MAARAWAGCAGPYAGPWANEAPASRPGADKPRRLCGRRPRRGKLMLTSSDRDRPLALLCFGRLWHGHRKYALLESCLDPIEIDPFRQRDRALDRAEATLREHVVPALFLLFLLLLALDSQHATGDLELDVALVHSGQLSRELVSILLLDHVDGGSAAPAAGEQAEWLELHACPAERRNAVVEILEHPVDFPTQGLERLPFARPFRRLGIPFFRFCW